MTRRERIRKTIQGEPTERHPMSFWRHFYDREGSAKDLAEAMLEFQRKYDWDFMKVNPRASYHVEDWGIKTERPGKGPLDKPKVVQSPVREPADWEKIRPLDPTKGTLGEMLDAEERIAAEIHGERVHGALRSITDTFIAFVRETMQRGASGIFFATTDYANPTRIDKALLEEFGRPYDLRVLEEAKQGLLNTIHVCGPRAFVR